MRTTLYRLYNAERELLYVGISLHFGNRLHQHAKDKPWYGQVVEIRLEHHRTRGEALKEESNAIKTEHPVHNIVHNTGAGNYEIVWRPTDPLGTVQLCGECGWAKQIHWETQRVALVCPSDSDIWSLRRANRQRPERLDLTKIINWGDPNSDDYRCGLRNTDGSWRNPVTTSSPR